MIQEILLNAGLVLNKTFRETRLLNPPKDVTYAVYMDACERRGSDCSNLIIDHDVTVELYEYYPDAEAETRLEAELDARGIEYSKQSRYWIHEEQLYQVVYEFEYTEKIR